MEEIDGGLSQFKGYDEQRSSSRHEGDDKNFIKEASENSHTHLEENIEFGDRAKGHSEIHRSSKSTSSSSQRIVSGSTVKSDQQPEATSVIQKSRIGTENRDFEDEFQKQHQQEMQKHHSELHERSHQERRFSEANETNMSRETSAHKQYVDMDKASPEYQNYVQHLMNQPGEILSNTVEYPKPNVRMITTVKRLPDGTIVRNKRYETEAEDQEYERMTLKKSQKSNTVQRRTSSSTTSSVVDSKDDYQRDVLRHQQYQDQASETQSDSMQKNLQERRTVDRNHQHYNEQYKSSSAEKKDEFNTRSTIQKHYHTSVEQEKKILQRSENYQKDHRDLKYREVDNDFTTHGFPSVRDLHDDTIGSISDMKDRSSDKSYSEHHEEIKSQRQRKEEVERIEEQKTSQQVKQQISDRSTSFVERENRKEYDQPIATSKDPHPIDGNRTMRNSDQIRVEECSMQQQKTTVKDFSTKGFPSVKEPSEVPRDPVDPVRTHTTVDNTRKREEDASHRAFAASLRSSPQRETTPTKSRQREYSPVSSVTNSERSPYRHSSNSQTTVKSDKNEYFEDKEPRRLQQKSPPREGKFV